MYQEPVKNFNKIREYIREFYINGFKSRQDYTIKSARSYDNEKRRIESYMTDNIHNHFVLNSVSFKDGYKYYSNLENTALFRKTSDDICDEFGLKVLGEKECKSGINFENFYRKSLKWM